MRLDFIRLLEMRQRHYVPGLGEYLRNCIPANTDKNKFQKILYIQLQHFTEDTAMVERGLNLGITQKMNEKF